MDGRDKTILRGLAARVNDISRDDSQARLRDMWRDHTSLRGAIPPLFVSPEGAWEEILPASALLCEDATARALEAELRRRLFRFESIRDDTPIERAYDIPVTWIPINEGWGLRPERVESAEKRGSWRWKPVVNEPSDWKKLRKPTLDVDVKGAQARCDALNDAVGDLMDIRVTGAKTFDFHIAHIYCDFRGLENLLCDLALEPDMVKDVFAFLAEGLEGLVAQAFSTGLVSPNNDHTYHYTGGLGYTRDLPPPDFNAARVRTKDVWAAAEAQEFSCVSPAMFYDTVLPFEKRLLTPFGLNGYGCCDDLTEKLDGVMQIPNLRRVAACPWADLGKMAQRLGKRYILTWKPQPSYLAEERFDDAFIEEYLYESLRAAKAGYPEIILRDTHTCRGEPARFTRFVQAARRAIARAYAT